VRIRREDWANLDAGDVAWVAEWQLATALAWVPLGDESPVAAEPQPDEGGRYWSLTIRAGSGVAHARIPVRDLARAIAWCYEANAIDLLRPPASIRASLLVIRSALRRSLAYVDPLARMGYADRRSHPHEQST